MFARIVQAEFESDGNCTEDVEARCAAHKVAAEAVAHAGGDQDSADEVAERKDERWHEYNGAEGCHHRGDAPRGREIRRRVVERVEAGGQHGASPEVILEVIRW